MKLFGGVLALAGGITLMASVGAVRQEAGPIAWRGEIDAAFAEAKQSGKPVFLVFR